MLCHVIYTRPNKLLSRVARPTKQPTGNDMAGFEQDEQASNTP